MSRPSQSFRTFSVFLTFLSTNVLTGMNVGPSTLTDISAQVPFSEDEAENPSLRIFFSLNSALNPSLPGAFFTAVSGSGFRFFVAGISREERHGVNVTIKAMRNKS